MVLLDAVASGTGNTKTISSARTAATVEAAWAIYVSFNPGKIFSSFYGLYEASLECSSCQALTTHFGLQSIISLDLPSPETSAITLHQLFCDHQNDHLGAEDHLCEGCKPAIHRRHICKCPPIMIITLNRWDAERRHKDTRAVEYPEVLHSRSICKDATHDCAYQLISVIVHRGSLATGHYTTIVKKGATCLEISDANIKSRHGFQDSNAYILVYGKSQEQSNVFGFANEGNSCYLAATVQMFSATADVSM